MKFNKLDLLIAIYIFCLTASELMGGKTFPFANIFGYQLNASVAIFLFPLIFTVNDIITEVHGKARARSVANSGFIIIGLIIITSFFFTQLPPSQRFANNNDAYVTVFTTSLRISIASLTAFGIANMLDILIFSKIKEKLGKNKLWLRNNLSNFISQLFDTTIFMTLAFYDLGVGFNGNFSFLISLIILYWLLKCFMSVIETPITYLGVKWLSKED